MCQWQTVPLNGLGFLTASERRLSQGGAHMHILSAILVWVGIIAVIGTALGNPRARRWLAWFLAGWTVGEIQKDLRRGCRDNSNQSPLNGQ